MADNLVLKGGTYHVRLDLPEDVQGAFGNRKILSKSLKTGSRAEAMRLRLGVLAQWKTQIQQVRERKAGEADRWREHLADFSKGVSSNMDTFLLHAARGKKLPGNPSPIDKEEMRKGLMTIAEHAEPEAFMAFLDVLISMKDDTISNVDYLNRLQDVYPKLMASVAGNLQELSRSEIAEAEGILTDPESYKPKSPIGTAKLDRFKDHLLTQSDNAKTVDQLVSRVRRISSYLTEKGLPLEFDTIHDFLKDISDSAKTRRQYLWSGKKFWTWAVRYDQDFRKRYASLPCPFEGHELPRNKAAQGESYNAFSKAEIERLHRAAIDKGDQALADLIQVAAFTGCRLEEIGRLKTEHTIYEGKVPVAFEVQQAKTKAGVRTVPIHPNLVPLYEKLVRDAGPDGYLFAGGKNKYGNRLDMLSKRFGRLKTAEGFDDSYVFHSVRKTTATELHQAGADALTIPAILGHEFGHISFDIYSKGPSLQQKAQAIGLLTFDFN
ncbi:tyrosine-type recombinase/integrase [Pseudomonas oryzihabitans]|uniref:tyrosine-type recombinase/integrase n=1 Tax=Pseudomonas oryzihabitans TaxID=47885 RepID=UPI0011A45CB6|nr:tyrosine-type recombinase/integrase [Pseudomonas oryzihabitans]